MSLAPRSLPPPRFLFLELNLECNLRCKHCHIWMNQPREGALSSAEQIRVVREFSELTSGQGFVILAGGETLLNAERFRAVQEELGRAGLRYSFVTNGTLLARETLPELFRFPPHSVVFSLDSARAELHDWLRGREGTFARVTQAIGDVVEFRRASGKKFAIFLNVVIFDRNAGEIAAIHELAERLGVDSIFFQPLLPTFDRKSPDDSFYREHAPNEASALRAELARIARPEARLRPRFPEYAENLARYFARPGCLTEEQVCDSAERNLIVDTQGNIKLCFESARTFPGEAEASVRTKTLAAFWNGPDTTRLRARMGECREACGLMNCHRRGAMDPAAGEL